MRSGGLGGGDKTVTPRHSEKWVSGLVLIPVQQGEEIGGKQKVVPCVRG